MIQLVRPTEERKEQAIKFRQEFFDHGEFVINGSELFAGKKLNDEDKREANEARAMTIAEL